MLKEVIPNASRVVYLWNPAEPGSDLQLKAVNHAALALNVRLKHLEASTPAEIEKAFQTMTKERIDALLVSRDSIFLVTRERVAALALKARLPTMHSFRDHVEAGGLISYAININSFIVHAASFVDKILRGAKPSELPVEQPTQFELVVNIKTARQLGITIPNSILVRADQVIE
jgi:putative ABC transport system substrate-binding protein